MGLQIYIYMGSNMLGFSDFIINERFRRVYESTFSDKPTPEHQKRLKEPSKKIVKWDDHIEANDPPHIQPEERSNELLKIKKFIQGIGQGEARRQASKYDHGMIKRFRKICEKNDLYFDENYFRQVKKDLADFSLREKYKWNLPRPKDTAKDMLVPHEEFFETETALTPSYPSGHAIQAYGIAGILGKVYPEHSDDFMKLANKIAISRVAGGMHYPVDIKEGKRLAKVLVDIVEDMPKTK